MNHKCAYSHKLSQNLLEKYLLDNLAAEFDRFRARTDVIQAVEKPRAKKRTKSAINAEMSRLNLLFQKGRIDFAYYNEEYSRLEQELKEMDNIIPFKADYSHIENLLESDFLQNYNSLTEASKQIFWHEIIESIRVSGKDIVAVDFRRNVSD